VCMFQCKEGVFGRVELRKRIEGFSTFINGQKTPCASVLNAAWLTSVPEPSRGLFLNRHAP
jgi:hypothetical protein